MRTSDRGLKLITQREGKILHVYKDSQGYPTAGVGHLLTAAERKQFPVGTPITDQQCTDWLRTDLKKCEDAVNAVAEVIPNPKPLTQNEFDALVSLSFNIGVGGFNRSTVARKLKAGDHKGAASAILLWNKPPEIQGRRRGEYHQFLTPYPSSAEPKPVQLAPEPLEQPDTTGKESADSQPDNSQADSPASPPFLTRLSNWTNNLNIVSGFRDSINPFTPSLSPISGMSWFMTIKFILGGWVLMVLAWLKSNPEFIWGALGLFALGIVIYIFAKGHAVERFKAAYGAFQNPVQQNKVEVNT